MLPNSRVAVTLGKMRAGTDRIFCMAFLILLSGPATQDADFDARAHMIEQQVRPWDCSTRACSHAGKGRREDFVLPRVRKLAFADRAAHHEPR